MKQQILLFRLSHRELSLTVSYSRLLLAFPLTVTEFNAAFVHQSYLVYIQLKKEERNRLRFGIELTDSIKNT